jgi:hypothetical protein
LHSPCLIQLCIFTWLSRRIACLHHSHLLLILPSSLVAPNLANLKKVSQKHSLRQWQTQQTREIAAFLHFPHHMQ